LIIRRLNLSSKEWVNPGKDKIMSQRNKKRHPNKHRDIKEEALRDLQTAGFDKETTDSLTKEIEEICAFEDSLED
jgi:hypothetical protein